MMGLIVLILLAVLEIVLVIRNRKDPSAQGKNRLMVRAAQFAPVVIAMLLPAGQKWRFFPVLVLLAILLAAAIIRFPAGKRQNADAPKKPARGIVSCVLCILLYAVFLFPAFLFTGYKGLPVSGSYKVGEASAILVDASRADPFESDGSAREVPVHFYYPVTGNNEAQQFPLVLFSHGAFGYYQSNTSTYMELAGSGYVVAALDHPHHAFFTQDTEGKTILVDQDFLNTAMALSGDGNSAVRPEEEYKIYQEWMALRTADLNFAVDELKSAAQGGDLSEAWFCPEGERDTIKAVLGTADSSRIGLMGHSMGGAASVALGRERDDISAVIDIDGTMLSEYTGVADGKLTVSEEPYTVPILEFVNWETHNELASFMEDYYAEGGRYPNDELMRHAAEGFTTTIRDTQHMDFTDLPLLSPALGKMLGSGERDTAETMTIVNKLVLQFYNCYLKGEGSFTAEDSY